MAIKTVETKLKLKVMHDEHAESPIEKTFNEGIVGNFICWSKQYSLGHKHNFKDSEDFFKELASEYNLDKVEELEEALEDDKISCKEYIDEIEEIVYNRDDIYILPLYLYEHGGITMNTTGFSCQWDSGMVGYVYTTKEILDNLGCVYNSREEVEEILKSEVELYDKYLKGEVYGFSIVEYDEKYGNEYDEIDSCWGFYGDDMKENGMIDSMSLSEEEIEELLIHGTNAVEYLVYN